MTSQKLLRQLKKKLPYRYASLIASKSGQLSIRQIRAVFNGETVNEKNILEVVSISQQIIKENHKKRTQITKKIQSIIS